MRAASLRKNGPFLSCSTPMFVPSPSWQNVRFYISLIGSKEPLLLTDADDVAGIPAPRPNAVIARADAYKKTPLSF